MSDRSATAQIDELVLELDLLVYSLERPAPSDEAVATAERTRVRREIERARDTLREVLRTL